MLLLDTRILARYFIVREEFTQVVHSHRFGNMINLFYLIFFLSLRFAFSWEPNTGKSESNILHSGAAREHQLKP